jgi:hypothetical protein
VASDGHHDASHTRPASARLDGGNGARRRIEVGAGAGIDHVGGYGRDQYPFVELGAEIEARWWRHLAVGAGAGLRQDLDDYNYALAQWRGRRSPALVARIFAGYDGPSFHLSAGPWLYGARRDRDDFRASVLPFGVLRMRVGRPQGWHVLLRLADGVAFTAEGGLALRALLASPPRGRHRPAGGLFTSVGENVLGVQAYDEIGGVGPLGTALRLGASLGLDLGHPGRPEATVFSGVVF